MKKGIQERAYADAKKKAQMGAVMDAEKPQFAIKRKQMPSINKRQIKH